MKKLFIIRGLPGSGKSTVVKQYIGATVCSADDFFMIDGKYVFDRSKIGQAHAACRSKAIDAMMAGVEQVVIDNTNTQRWEYLPYVELSAQYGYEVEVIAVGNLHDVELYAKRNVHGVPLAAIKKMAARWE